jgi:hypothetical protein
MIQLPSMSFRLIEAESEHLPIVVGRAFAGRNTAPYLLPVEVELPHSTPVQRAAGFGH